MQKVEEFVGSVRSTKALERWKKEKKLKFEQVQQCVRFGELTGLIFCPVLTWHFHHLSIFGWCLQLLGSSIMFLRQSVLQNSLSTPRHKSSTNYLDFFSLHFTVSLIYFLLFLHILNLQATPCAVLSEQTMFREMQKKKQVKTCIFLEMNAGEGF